MLLGYVVVRTLAAGPLAAFEPEAGVLSGAAVAQVASGASGGTIVVFGAPLPTTTPTNSPGADLYGWQLTAANVGLASVGLTCSSLPLYTGSPKPASGTVITGRRIPGSLDLSAGNITIDRSCVQPATGTIGSGLPVITTTDNNACTSAGCAVTPATVTISNSEIDGSMLSAHDAAFATGLIGIANMMNNYIHDLGSGIGLMNTGKTLDAVIEHNYITRLKAYGDGATTGNHSDGFTIRDFDAGTKPSRTVVVRNNRFDCNSGNDTGAFFIQTYAGNINNVTVTGNLLEGSGYNLGLNQDFGNTYTNVTASNNRFTPSGYGAAYVQGGLGWNSWSGNYLNDPSKGNNQGAVVPKP